MAAFTDEGAREAEAEAARAALAELREAVRGEEDAEGFVDDDKTLKRYLAARNGSVPAAAKMIKATLKWRGEMLAELNHHAPPERPAAPALSMANCRFCEGQVGYHPMRQVGFDLEERPVLYIAFSQATNWWFKVADTKAHLVPVLENAGLTMRGDADQFVWVIDYTGFGLGCCNPAQSAASIHILQNHYPERLCKAICINAPWGFSTFWSAISHFIDERTRHKVVFCSSDDAFRDECVKSCSVELVDWLCTEQRLNKQSPMPPLQKAFWEPPPKGEHDPRGSPSFVAEFIDGFDAAKAATPADFMPHPNIQKHLRDLAEGGHDAGDGSAQAGGGAAAAKDERASGPTS